MLQGNFRNGQRRKSMVSKITLDRVQPSVADELADRSIFLRENLVKAAGRHADFLCHQRSVKIRIIDIVLNEGLGPNQNMLLG